MTRWLLGGWSCWRNVRECWRNVRECRRNVRQCRRDARQCWNVGVCRELLVRMAPGKRPRVPAESPRVLGQFQAALARVRWETAAPRWLWLRVLRQHADRISLVRLSQGNLVGVSSTKRGQLRPIQQRRCPVSTLNDDGALEDDSGEWLVCRSLFGLTRRSLPRPRRCTPGRVNLR